LIENQIITKTGGKMSLVIPKEVIKASGLSEDELLREIVIMLFQQDKISLGKASELLRISQIKFQRLLSERGICIHYDVAEFQEDIRHLQEKGWL
jgi:predicted HTH domain antitoxin